MDKQIIVYPSNEILLNNKQEYMTEFPDHCTMLKKSDKRLLKRQPNWSINEWYGHFDSLAVAQEGKHSVTMWAKKVHL